MGIDFGSKKVGIAITDENGSMAFPHSVLANDKSLLSNITDLIDKEGIKEIVIGHSLDLAGNPNPIHSQVEEFIADITMRSGIPIHLQPEQFTTQEAIRIQGRNKKTDASAAAIILESFIE